MSEDIRACASSGGFADGSGRYGDRPAGARVERMERARLISAMCNACAERGATNVTVTDVVAWASVSRRAFYRQFENIEECLVVTVDDAIMRTSRRVLPHYRGAGRWYERMRAALEALLAFFDSDPSTARLLVVETLAAGPVILERRADVIGALIAAVAEGSAEAEAGVISPLAAEATVGAVLSVLHDRLVHHGEGPLSALASQLMSTIVLPFLGSAASRRELERPMAWPGSQPAIAREPLIGPGVRLTYRTMRVIVAIGECPGQSNRVVGRIAGVDDQGQISKLLARLKKLRLIENTGSRRSTGVPNAWTLTEKGRQAWASISAQGQLARERRSTALPRGNARRPPRDARESLSED